MSNDILNVLRQSRNSQSKDSAKSIKHFDSEKHSIRINENSLKRDTYRFENTLAETINAGAIPVKKD